MADDCYACKVAERHPATKLKSATPCISCSARDLALTHGGMKAEAIDTALHLKWPATAEFKQGRSLFWIWVRRINEVKATNAGAHCL